MAEDELVRMQEFFRIQREEWWKWPPIHKDYDKDKSKPASIIQRIEEGTDEYDDSEEIAYREWMREFAPKQAIPASSWKDDEEDSGENQDSDKTKAYKSEAEIFRHIYHPSALALVNMECLRPVHHLILDELFLVKPSITVSLSKYCYEYFIPKLYTKVCFNDPHNIPVTGFMQGYKSPNGRKKEALRLVREVCIYFPPLVYVPKGELQSDGTREMIPTYRRQGVRTGYRHSWQTLPPGAKEIPLLHWEICQELGLRSSIYPDGIYMPNAEKTTFCGYMGDYLFKGNLEAGNVSRYRLGQTNYSTQWLMKTIIRLHDHIGFRPEHKTLCDPGPVPPS
ncbi:hypothetical protein L198_07794 [Cryptococcus wingfieldii CBS 7118]|uniref:Uncharacterized protein n=1 Tax=Cryptococcus wingfieldii CBS 7118 TaxID=1295528 RepID=A0A1E3HYA2_9TREE|nr:hypothetical protein L198_07794 [Cryptococcus wingfieldii CBS 7118]ODN81308.1 hypothetical protein L198_07794 [Cryptococcus wingfieldii CBS 7118]